MIAKPQPLFKTLETLKKGVLELELENESLKKDCKKLYKLWQEEERKRKELENKGIQHLLKYIYENKTTITLKEEIF